jgi:hypothetical protein
LTGSNSHQLTDILSKSKTAILNTWFERIIGTYPEDSQRFFLSEKNDFANPVGSSISHGMNALFDALCSDAELNSEEIYPFLDRIIRVRAVQDFSPAQAIAFVFMLKKIILETLGKELERPEILRQLLTFDSRIDTVALLAFNNFMQCREKIYELRAKEIRDRTSRIVERACQILGSGREALEDVPSD